jgi:hypothetical protein
VQLGPSFSRTRDNARFFTSIGDPSTTDRRYVFAQLDQTTLSANLRLDVSFTPTMSLQFFGQPLVSTAEFGDLKELARPNSLDFLGPEGRVWAYDPAARTFDPDGLGPAEAYRSDFNFKSLRGNAVFRWEYLPGSTFYLVWTQERTDEEPTYDFDAGPNFRRLVRSDADNIFLAKVTYYLTR